MSLGSLVQLIPIKSFMPKLYAVQLNHVESAGHSTGSTSSIGGLLVDFVAPRMSHETQPSKIAPRPRDRLEIGFIPWFFALG